jgi:hypothetical protein
MRHFLAALLVVVILPLIALGSGFLYFAESITTERSDLTGSADGIVALTGGALRIDDAMALLAASKARRLLISGVNPATPREAVRDLVSQHAGLFDCCVDLDRDARDTIGNAAESAEGVDAGAIGFIERSLEHQLQRLIGDELLQPPGDFEREFRRFDDARPRNQQKRRTFADGVRADRGTRVGHCAPCVN